MSKEDQKIGNFDMGSLSGSNSPITVNDFGATIEKADLTRFDMEEGLNVVGLLSTKSIAVNRHYDKRIDKQSFYCFNGECCLTLKPPRTYIIYPVIVYTVTDPDEQEYELSAKFAYMAMNTDTYEQLKQQFKTLSKSPNVVDDISMYDIIVNCSDKKYKKASYTIDTSVEAMWRDETHPKHAKFAAGLLKFQSQYVNLIQPALGKTIDAKEFAAQMNTPKDKDGNVIEGAPQSANPHQKKSDSPSDGGNVNTGVPPLPPKRNAGRIADKPAEVEADEELDDTEIDNLTS